MQWIFLCYYIKVVLVSDMKIQEFADFVVEYSQDNFSFVNEPELVAVYGMIEEWGEFVGEYKRLVRDGFSEKSIKRFDENSGVELSDVIAYWIIRVFNVNFGVVVLDDVSYDKYYISLAEAIPDVTKRLTQYVLFDLDEKELLNRLVSLGGFIEGGIESAFDKCVDKLKKRGSVGDKN